MLYWLSENGMGLDSRDIVQLQRKRTRPLEKPLGIAVPGPGEKADPGCPMQKQKSRACLVSDQWQPQTDGQQSTAVGINKPM
jgi:hypothetical protein